MRGVKIMIKKASVLSLYLLVMLSLCAMQSTYLQLEDNVTVQLGEPIMIDINALINKRQSSPIFSSYLLTLELNVDMQTIGSYEGWIHSPWKSYPITCTLIDTKPPVLTLEKKVFVFDEGEPIQEKMILDSLIISEENQIQSTKILPALSNLTVGEHNITIQVTDIANNNSFISCEVIITPKHPSHSSPPLDSSTPIIQNVCPNGNFKIDSNKDCHQPAYDEYPDKIGSLSQLQEHATTLNTSYFITNITLNDRSEMYGLWITDE